MHEPESRKPGFILDGLADEVDRCAYCGTPLLSEEVPDVGDDQAWASRAAEHRPGCEWVETRAHRRPRAGAGG